MAQYFTDINEGRNRVAEATNELVGLHAMLKQIEHTKVMRRRLARTLIELDRVEKRFEAIGEKTSAFRGQLEDSVFEMRRAADAGK